MSYNSSFTGQQADAALQRAAVIQTDGDGTKFLSDDGTYKEAGDKTNVLILSLENDLANGEKDSPIAAEVSDSLVDAITNGKACVIKSANSDILSNLQQIGSNVTIIMEQISRVGQTFVAVNTSITVNTSTNVIADYQTGAIVLETEGDGSKFLADDGTYKGINGAYSFDYNNITNDTYTGLQNAIANNQAIVMNNNGGRYQILKASDNTSNIQLLWINAYTASDSDNRCKAILYRLTLNSDLSKNLKLSYVKRAYAAKNLDSYLTPATFVSSYENYQPDTVILYINDANNAAVVFSGLADIDRSKDITINQVQQVNGNLYNFYLTIPVTGNMAYGAIAIASSNQYLDMSIFTGESGTLSEEDYQKVVNAYNNKVTAGYTEGGLFPISIIYEQQTYAIVYNPNIPDSEDGVSVDAVNLHFMYIVVRGSDKGFNVISDRMILQKSGDGTKFLSDDGTYKTVSGGDDLISQSDQNAILNAINSITNSELSSGGALSEEKYNAIVSATPEAIKTLGGSSNGVYIRYDRFGQSTPTSGMVALSGIYTYNDGAISFMSRDLYTGLYLGIMGYNSVQFANLSISSSRQISYSLKNIQFDSSGDGTKFLTDDGSYKTVSSQPMKVLTESEYAALGTTPETDGVLYFVTPDSTN